VNQRLKHPIVIRAGVIRAGARDTAGATAIFLPLMTRWRALPLVTFATGGWPALPDEAAAS